MEEEPDEKDKGDVLLGSLAWLTKGGEAFDDEDMDELLEEERVVAGDGYRCSDLISSVCTLVLLLVLALTLVEAVGFSSLIAEEEDGGGPTTWPVAAKYLYLLTQV